MKAALGGTACENFFKANYLVLHDLLTVNRRDTSTTPMGVVSAILENGHLLKKKKDTFKTVFLGKSHQNQVF